MINTEEEIFLTLNIFKLKNNNSNNSFTRTIEI